MMFSGNFLLVKVKGKQANNKKKTVFIVFLGLKDLSGWNADERCHHFRWYPSLFLQTLVLIVSWKSTHVKIHTKMASFWLVVSAKKTVKFDKLALIEGKILNLMFLNIYIPAVPIENWLRVTHKNYQSFQSYCSAYFKDHTVARMRL